MTDTSPTAADELAARLRERYGRFLESARTIGNFVSDSEKSVASLIQRNADTLARLQYSEPGDNEPEEDDAKSVTLSDEEAQYLTKLLAEHGGTLQQYPQILFEMAFIILRGGVRSLHAGRHRVDPSLPPRDPQVQ